MTEDLAFPKLEGWQAGLVLAQQRLGNPAFRLELNQDFTFADQGAENAAPESWTLAASAHGLVVEVLRTGRDLVKLRMRLEGSLQAGNTLSRFKAAQLDLVTSFQVQRSGSSCQVVANLGDPRGNVSVTTSECAPDDLEIAVEHWVREQGGRQPITLFTFDARAGQDLGAGFQHFAVTTCFAEVAPLSSSFVLLMGDATAPTGSAPPVLDPHLLPQGETAVLWVSRPVLERTSGIAVAEDARHQLALRPRPLGIDLPGITAPLASWAATIVNHVTVPDGIAFTAMQMATDGLMLSATPQSIEELKQLTASDLTLSRQSLVELKANALFDDCLLHHLDETYRKQLLGVKDKPSLPAEVAELVKPYADWLATFARLQVAQLAKSQAKGDMAPYTRLSKAKVKDRIRTLSLSKECKAIVEGLYPLAFCLVRPRLSLYIDQRANWLPQYRAHMASDAYVDDLLTKDDPAKRLHDDAAKLRLLEPDAKQVDTLVADVSGRFLERHAARNWKVAVTTRPAEFRAGFATLLQGLYAATAPDTLPDDWVAKAGGAQRVAQQCAPAFAAEAAHPRPSTVKDVAIELAAALPLGGGRAADAIAYAAGGAVVATLLAPTQALAANAGLDDLTPFVTQIAEWFVQAATGGLAAAGLTLNVRTIVLLGIKGIKWISETVTMAVQGATKTVAATARFFATTAGQCFQCAGAMLSLVSAMFAIGDLVDDIGKHDIIASAADAVSALVSFMAYVAIVAAPAGPWATGLMLVGLAIGLFRFIWTLSRKNAEELAADQLVDALVADGMAA